MNWPHSPSGPRRIVRNGSTRFARSPPPASAWLCRCAHAARSSACCCWGAAAARRLQRAREAGLRACADQFALMIENARLTDRVVEQETLRRDIALASDVQRRLLPDAPPRAEFADFAAVSVPARRIGGDYYDFLELRDRAIGIALADVSGKGVAAALDHVRRAGVAADHLVRGRRAAAAPRRAHERVRLPVDAVEQVRHVLLCAARRAAPAAALRQRRPQPAVSLASRPAIHRRLGAARDRGTVRRRNRRRHVPGDGLRRGDRRVVPRRRPPRVHRRCPRGAQPRERRVRRGTPAAAAPRRPLTCPPTRSARGFPPR